TFTCEGPEYWAALAQGYPSNIFYFDGSRDEPIFGPKQADGKGDKEKLLAFYRQYVSKDVKMEELFFEKDIHGFFSKQPCFKAGEYNPFNRWNTRDGIMHLTHHTNLLKAEIILAANATLLQRMNNRLVQEADQLICRSKLGGPNRSSDPHI